MAFDDLVHESGFQIALCVGALALIVVVVVALSTRRSRRRRTDPLPVAGIALVVAALIGLGGGGDVDVSGRLVAGLVVLAVGTYLASRRLSWLTATLATIPGAALVAWAAELENHRSWVPPLVFIATAIGGVLVADFDRANARAGLGPVLLAVTALAMYTTLPDTEEVAAVVGAALPFVLLGAPRPLASLGGPGATSVVGLLVWIAAVDGRGRAGSVVGAIACLGVMLVEPLVRRALPLRLRSSPPAALSPRAILVVALHVGLVAVAARVAGRRISAVAAAEVAVPALVAAAVGLAIVLMLGRRSASASPSPST